MKSKAEVIKTELAGKRVLDIGGCGFGANNAYERQLQEAWSVVASRTTVDRSGQADISVDLNREWPTLPASQWDITTAFDILEHLENPIAVLRAIPTDQLLVSLPNVLSPVCRRLEKIDMLHLYSFTDYTARTLLTTAGWKIEQLYYTFGKWSWASRLINAVGSLAPAWVGTGLMIHCRRK